MQDGHRQDPMLFVVRSAAAETDEQIEREALEDLQEVLERHLSRLPTSSEWRPAFVRMQVAASQSLGQPPLQLVQPARQG